MTSTIDIASGRRTRPTWLEVLGRVHGATITEADGRPLVLDQPIADGSFVLERDEDYCGVFVSSDGRATASRAGDEAPRRHRQRLAEGTVAIGYVCVELSPIGSEEFAREVAAALADALDGLAMSEDAIFADVRWLDGARLRETIGANPSSCRGAQRGAAERSQLAMASARAATAGDARPAPAPP